MAQTVTESRNHLRAICIFSTLNNHGAALGNMAILLIEESLDTFDATLPPVCSCGRKLIVTEKCPVCDNDD